VWSDGEPGSVSADQFTLGTVMIAR
jgi:hypothetical protein